MKIFEKMLIIFILTFAIISTYSFTSVYGDTKGNQNGTSGSQTGTSGSQTGTTGTQVNPDKYKPGDITSKDSKQLIKIGGEILSIIKNVGVIISVVVLSIIGVKYMFSSVEEKANYKETMFPLIVGMLLLLGSSILVQVLYTAFKPK